MPTTTLKPERQELAEGIFFNCIPIDKFKTEHLSIRFILPLSNAAAASRIALLPRVLLSGCRNYPTAAALTKRQEELYSANLTASVFKFGDQQGALFTVSTLRRDFVPDGQELLPEAARLLNEVIFDPVLDPQSAVFLEDYVEREKQNLINRIRSVQNNKAAYAAQRCEEIMHEAEPCGINKFGTVEEVTGITPAALYAAYRALLSEARIEIFYEGTEEGERVLSYIRPAIDRIRRYPNAAPPMRSSVKKGRVKKVTERTDAFQARLCLGFRTGVDFADRDALTLSLCNYVYAASPTSKLFVNVREKLSLCYSCSSALSLSTGTLLVSAGLETSKRRRAIREIRAQLRKMKAGKITERELMMAKKTLEGAYLSLYDSPMALENWYLVRFVFGAATDLEATRAAIADITVKDLARVAAAIKLDTVYFLRAEHGGEEVEEDE